MKPITPNRRFEAMRILLRLEKKQMCEALDTYFRLYTEVINDKRPLPASWVETLFTKYSVHPHWIITGENPMFLLPKAS